MTLTVGPGPGERQGWSDVMAAVRRVPPRVVQLLLAVAVLCLLAWAIAHVVRPAPSAAPTARVAVPSRVVDQDQAEPARARCSNCGVVESIRPLPPVEGRPAGYVFTVRLRDGSVRTSTTTGKASWDVGDRILLLGGAAAP